MIDKAESAREAVRLWVERCVLSLNLCPFAHKPYREGKVRISSCPIEPRSQFKEFLIEEFRILTDSDAVSNTLLVLEDQGLGFYEYLDLLEQAEQILFDEDLEGVYQIASFHPEYLFAGEEEASRSHFTNRSPWPILHLLREEEISKAVDSYKNTESIPEANKKTLNSLTDEQFMKLFGSLIKQR